MQRSRLAVLIAVISSLLAACGSSTETGQDAGQTCAALPSRFDSSATISKGCYYAQQSPTLNSGVTLTLEPGVTIIFSQGVDFSFSGDQALVAVGTATDPIVLTGAQSVRGFWKGLLFDGTTVESRLAYVTVEYAGNTDADPDAAAVKATSDSGGVKLALSNTTLRQSQGWGLWLAAAAQVSTFANNTLTKNALGPVSVDSAVTALLDAASTYTGNDVDRVRVRAYHLEKAATWNALGVPYALESSLSLQADLTVAPGVTFIMAPQTSITVSGDDAALIANGTASKPIVFTSDAHQRGTWVGITFDGSNNTRNAMSFATVEWAGDTTHDEDGANVRLISDSHGVQLKMSNCTLRQSMGYGLYLGIYALIPQFDVNALTQNQLGPAKVASEAAHQLPATSTYLGNDVDRVAVFTNRVEGPITWQDIGVAYDLDGLVHVDNVWTLAPGVKLMMEQAAGIEVGSDDCGFHAAGTAEKPILITGATQTPGAWGSIVFDTTLNASNVIEHTTIEYGGGNSASGYYGMIVAQSDSHRVSFTLTSSSVRSSAVYGIWLGKFADATISPDTTYEANASGDLFREQ